MARTTNLNALFENALNKQEETDLTEPEINLLELARLIVDIEYEYRYTKTLTRAAS